MFRTKKDVDRHVTDILSKIHNDDEKNHKGYTFAKLYFQAKDFVTAKRYLTGFLQVRDHHAPAHKLMGQIYENDKNFENALQSYKRSLEIDSTQRDIVLKICELYCKLPVDHETAKYWADRAEDIYPHNEIVFKLRENLMSADGGADYQELEKLIKTELQSQPKNVNLKIKLLKLYLDTERLKEAYTCAIEVESKRLFPGNVELYYLLGDIFEAYQEDNQNLDSQFYIHYLSTLDHLISITLAEPHSSVHEDGKKHYSVNDAAAVLVTFDQVLKSASEQDVKDSSWKQFFYHMKGQLFYYMTCVLSKRTKLEQGNHKEAIKFISGLAVVCYTFKPINILQEIRLLQMGENQKLFLNFFQQASLRTSYIGHIIKDICKEDKGKWLQKLKNEVCLPQVKERIFSRVFDSVSRKDQLSSSYFLSDSTFENCSLEFPSDVALFDYDKTAYKLCPDSLHHLVWFELRHRASESPIFDDNLSEVFEGLQYSNNHLSRGSCESLSILDLEAYLWASVYQAQALLEKKKAVMQSKSQLPYPPNISDALCTKQQASWWKAAYDLHSCSAKEKLSEYRRLLQQGLEVIRGIGNHGMEIQLVVFLARTFADKADYFHKDSSSDNKKKLVARNVTALQLRSLHYWKIALGMLDKLAEGQTLGIPKEQMFIGSSKALSKNEVNSLREQGRLYMAVHLMNNDKLEEAAEMLSKLSTPHGSYYLALTLKRLAAQEEHFSKTRAALLSRAKDSILETMDRIKDDKSHPLNQELFHELEDIESELASDFSTNNSHDDEDEADYVDSCYSPQFNSSLYLTPNSHRSGAAHSTPRPSSKFICVNNKSKSIKKEPSKHFEPSPERLDAQLRALTLSQDTLMKSFVEQQKTFIEQQKSTVETNKSIVEALKHNTEVLEQLKKFIDDLKISGAVRGPPKSSSRKTSYNSKGQGDEEDYGSYDPTMLDYYPEEGGDDYRTAAAYGYSASSRMLHEAPSATSLNYVMSPAIPPGPPHYNYQYPHHPVLPAPPVAEQTPFYAAPGQGLPFSEGQQLPQFQFHVASPVVKPPGMPGGLPRGVALPPPPVMPPPPMQQTPWPKPVPHNFQIPLPVSSAVPPPQQSESQLKILLESSGPPATAGASLFAACNKTPEATRLERSRCDSENAGSPDVDGHDLEREVMGDFKPLIPLPAEIEVETGEENEEVLFEDRAKLYRFAGKEWKERGIGVVKILHHEQSGRVRLLMRRDQIFKICANHYITSNMEIQPLKSSDFAWTWVAQDFADEELKPEHFCIRFKTIELAAGFKAAFDKALAISKESEEKKQASPHTPKSKTDTSSAAKPFGAAFLPKSGSWTCATCYVSNAPDRQFCAACEDKKPGLQIPTVSSSSKISSSNTLAQTSNLSFKLEGSQNQFTFGTPKIENSFSLKPATTPPKTSVGGFTFTSPPTICESESPELKEREILVVSGKSKNGLQVTKVNQMNSPFSNFSFVKTTTTTPTTTTLSSLTVQFSDNARNVSFGSTATTTTSAASPLSSGLNLTPTVDSSLSKLQCMVSKPTFVFGQKEPAGEVQKTPPALGSFIPKSPGEGEPEEFVPTAEFKPVVPLPALVDLKTGEEEEEKLFEERAKLFRYDIANKEWKERGVGDLKILHQKEGDKYRVLMRRDLVLKLCANHYILPEMKLSPMASSDKSWVWYAQDYADGDLKDEQFAARFKTAEIAQNFKKVFQNCQQKMTEAEKSQAEGEGTNPCSGNVKAFDQLMQSTANSWECTQCHKSNMNLASCVYCKAPKPADGSKKPVEQKPLSELFKPEAGSWECPGCYVRNNSNTSKCPSCETMKPGASPAPAQEVKTSFDKTNSFGDQFKPEAGSWECSTCYVRNNSTTSKCASCETPKPGSDPAQETKTPSIFGGTQIGGGFTFGPKSGTSPFTFGKPQADSGGFVFGARPSMQSSTFTFGQAPLKSESSTPGFKPSLPASNSPAVFGGVTQKASSDPPSTIFGSNSSASMFDFSSFTSPKKSEASQEFKFGSPQKYEFNFTGVRPRSPSKTPKSPRSPQSPSDVEEEVEDSDADGIYFTPVIPLPPKVEVKTGEEEEKTLFCQRAKLFRFSNGEWKERGVGDIKILLDEKANKLRLLMRRDQVLKVCLNHYLTKDMSFQWQGDKSLTWTATDFSENTPSPELLAVRFKTVELANEFKAEITSAIDRVKEFGGSTPSASPNVKASPSPSSQAISNAASSFSFKSDSPKAETGFASGSLSSQFGSSMQPKSLFGNASSGFSFSNASSSSPFAKLLKDKPPVGSFFGQPAGFVFGGPSAFDQGAELKNDDPDIQIVEEITATKEQVDRAVSLLLPKNFFLYETRAKQCPGCIGCEDRIPSYKDVSDEQEEKKASSASPKETPSTPIAGELFANSTLKTFSFTDLASTGTFENLAKSSPSGRNAFAGAGAPIFSSLNNSTDDGNEDPSQGPDIHFEPIIPLPDLVEVTTGEEDEAEMFVQRAKLFRYDGNTKQWKERGIGDIKILRHKEKNRFRVILRREQVHNVACNHCISEEMALTPLATSETALCWNALDYSDSKEPVLSQFAVRFKNKELMNKFKQVFEECQEMLRIGKEVEKSVATEPAVATPNQVNSTAGQQNASKNEVDHESDNSTDEDEQDTLFEKRATLEIYDETTKQFKPAGLGNLVISYDGEVFGYRISMKNDKEELLCDHIIAVQTCLRVENKRAIWAAVDLTTEPPSRRQFRVNFSSLEAVKEFSKIFEEGKESAAQVGIVENS